MKEAIEQEVQKAEELFLSAGYAVPQDIIRQILQSHAEKTAEAVKLLFHNKTVLKKMKKLLDMPHIRNGLRYDISPKFYEDIKKELFDIDQALALLWQEKPCKTCGGSKEKQVYDEENGCDMWTPCPACNGTGLCPDFTAPTPKDKPFAFRQKSCPDCKGTGRAEKCVAGCKLYTGREIYHHKDCPFYPESFSKLFDALTAERDELGETLSHQIKALRTYQSKYAALKTEVERLKAIIKRVCSDEAMYLSGVVEPEHRVRMFFMEKAVAQPGRSLKDIEDECVKEEQEKLNMP